MAASTCERGFISVTGGKRVITEQPAAASKVALTPSHDLVLAAGWRAMDLLPVVLAQSRSRLAIRGGDWTVRGGRKSRPGSPVATIT